MPSQPNKPKSKNSPSGSIKLEPQPTFPLSHYAEDPVELVRQVFLCLKSKTIKSMAPDFLQTYTIERIQEFCLDEILGISKKRLLSIINATKCPSDTEDSDSDVENIEEHISLEEISSDSADELAGVRKKSKKVKAAKSGSKSKTNNGTVPVTDAIKSTKGGKQMSVLELLELQARARAIRSQLALEPVTKIELDSEEEDENTVNLSVSPENNVPKSVSQEPQPVPKINNGAAETSKRADKRPPIKLKRNFRQRQSEYLDDDVIDKEKEDMSDQRQSNESSPKDRTQIDSVPNLLEVNNHLHKSNENIEAKPVVVDKDFSEQSEARCSSPDIITIIPSPKTFIISSDSENEDEIFLKRIKTSHYITIPEVVTVDKPETEDEKFLKKVREAATQMVESTDISKDCKSHIDDITSDETSNILTECIEEKQKESKEPSEHEDGELIDEDEEVPTIEEVPVESSSDAESDIIDENINDLRSEDDVSNAVVEDNKISSPNQLSAVEDAIEIDDDNENTDDVDDDDDIIDLGKDEEMDFELRDDVGEHSKEMNPAILKDNIDASDNNSRKDQSEQEGHESWGTRWLRGRNVTKVLATSRLANKVRSKIKKNKKDKLAESVDHSSSGVNSATTPTVPAPSLFEEGSVKQYEELTCAEKPDEN